MKDGISKARSHVKPPPTALLERLDVDKGQDAGNPQGSRGRSLVSGDLDQDSSVQSTSKRRHDVTSELKPSPEKRARLTRTETKDSRDTGKNPELVVKEQSNSTSPGHSLKRQICSGDDSDGKGDKHLLKRARLTRKNLTLFNKMGRKKGISKTSASTLASAFPESVDESSTTKTTSTTTSGFAMQARKNGILHPISSKPPANLEERRKRDARSRETASPPETVFEGYSNRVAKVPNEATMVFEVGERLLKQYDDKGYQRAFNQAFTAFPKDVGFNKGLSAPQPDFVEGLEMEEFDPFPIDDCVDGAVLYKDNPFSILLLHIAGEWKGPGKDMETARLQSAYDGAALVYARNQALSYLGSSDPPGHAEVTTFTTDGTTLNEYLHYAETLEDGSLRYHQYPIQTTHLTSSYQAFKEGRRSLRNAQDYAKEQSNALKDQLQDHWKRRRSAPQPVATGQFPSASDAALSNATKAYRDEDDDGYELVEQPCQPIQQVASKPERQLNNVMSPRSHSSSSGSLPTMPPVGGDGGSGAQKRKASLSQESSRESSRRGSNGRSYWVWDAGSGCYFHKHSDGRITWQGGD